ncbi:MAG: alpha/beta hydrolase, partial [Clostridia bacterium]|nr:alpha/beta hydrolase [Clostridia bacterium]
MTYAIDAKETVTLGGVPQNIRIRSADPALPVVLFLHGGPGVCERHQVLKYQSGLAGAATLVCWDQRGSGLSYDKKLDPGTMTVSRMVDDAAELVDLLRKRFGKEKIIIVGHSWGTLLGTLLAYRYPDGVQAYVGMGQYVDGDENEAVSYQFVLDEARKLGDKKAVKALERVGAPVKGHYKNLDDLMVQRNLMTKYGGGTFGEKDSLMKSLVLPLLRTSEYSLFDIIKYRDGAFFSLKTLWEEVVDVNFFEEVKALSMPVYLTEGRHDQNTPI